uniref:Uncharacterized protein n=1 Tax=viral metagenome TaxID=1070528 RepID=A0A6C0EJT9_9ZZZZ
MNSREVLKYFDVYLHAQNDFCQSVCAKLWPNNTEHFWEKWISSGKNLLYFMARLDSSNKKLVIDWILKIRDKN